MAMLFHACLENGIVHGVKRTLFLSSGMYKNILLYRTKTFVVPRWRIPWPRHTTNGIAKPLLTFHRHNGCVDCIERRPLKIKWFNGISHLYRSTGPHSAPKRLDPWACWFLVSICWICGFSRNLTLTKRIRFHALKWTSVPNSRNTVTHDGHCGNWK